MTDLQTTSPTYQLHQSAILIRNEYRVDGDEVIITLRRRKGPPTFARVSIGTFFSRVAGISTTWCAMLSKDGTCYAFSKDYSFYFVGGKTRYLHRVCAGLADDDPRVPDHRNFCGLDNTDGNLIIATRSQNASRRRLFSTTPRHNHLTGVRGVRLCRKTGRFFVVVKARYFGIYNTLEAAAAKAEAVRAEHNSRLFDVPVRRAA